MLGRAHGSVLAFLYDFNNWAFTREYKRKIESAETTFPREVTGYTLAVGNSNELTGEKLSIFNPKQVTEINGKSMLIV